MCSAIIGRLILYGYTVYLVIIAEKTIKFGFNAFQPRINYKWFNSDIIRQVETLERPSADWYG